MDIREFTEFTNKLLSKLSGSSQSSYSFNERIYEQIKSMHSESYESPRVKTEKFKVKGGRDFKVPENVSSMPYISGIYDNGDVELQTIEPGTFKMSGGSRVSNAVVASRLAAFRNEVPAINKAAFGEGIDLDNFTVLNVSEAPMNKQNMKYMLERGNVLPLGSNHGVFMPDFALKDATWMSAEYEGVFTRRHDSSNYQESFDFYATDPVKETFGFDVRALLSHDAGGHHNQYSYQAYDDHTGDARRGRHQKEVVFGAAPMSNMIFAMNSTFAAWDKTGLVDPRDRVLGYKSGMHISTTVPAVGNSQSAGAINNYLKHSGVVLDALSRTSERWKSTSYLGIPSGGFSDNRYDFRLGTNSNRLESRFPAAVMDTAHLASQFAVVAKITSDTQRYAEKYSGERTHSTSSYGHTLAGQGAANTNLHTPLHVDNNSENGRKTKQWFNTFMETLGITDDFEKEFMLDMNKRCGNTRA